jgi:hypothetical protein
MHRIARLALPAVAILIIGMIGGSAASTKSTPTRQDMAKKILSSGASRNLTGPARAYVESTARGDHRLAPDSSGITQKGNKVNSAKPVGGGSLTNVRVNNPALDTHQVAQTTQSETTVAVAGSNVVVGYNDSQGGLLTLVAGDNLTGYAYSTDGGQTFTDGGGLPNAGGSVNVGDPWLATDSGGNMYFSTLTIDGVTGMLLVGVSRSTDGGKTWTPAASIPPPQNVVFTSADKDALTTGPGNGNLYAAWDDFSFDSNFNLTLGLPVAHSSDGGQTWTTSYAAQFTLDPTGLNCSFKQWIGAQPFVNGGAVYVAAEQLNVDDPTCTGGTVTLNETVYISHDSGASWSPGAVIPITPSTQIGAFVLAPSQYMRNAEFPTLAAFKNNVYMAWNDGGDGSGHSHIRLAQLNSSGGQVGSTSFVTSGNNDEAQPALTGDQGGLHVAYYQISTASNGNGQLDVFISNSSNGNSWKTQRVTSQSFPGVYTLPQFDPLIAPAYMGDYIAQASDGQHQFIAWGDNRDIVKDFLWPNGRNDPDVFFAKQ